VEKALNGGIPSELSIDVVSVHATLRSFIQDQFKNIGAQNAILGLSGGIDSALVGFLTADVRSTSYLHHAVPNLRAKFA
jgi:NH3-dependent NAD+ synthetase